MNMYTELLNRIYQLSEPLSNTITQGSFQDIDLSNSNIYPLIHTQIDGGNLNNGQVITFSVRLGCFQQRMNNNTYEIDKYYGNDNEVDNMNETLSKLITIWSNLERDFAGNDITASEDPQLEPERNAYENGLDGWILSFDVELPITKLSLCE